ncbi:FAD-binding protein [Eggerthella sinensis]|uniref:FAD-binding protein n=1 Tax=Eggerthella sinensis TaxID=242230 RepID=UPI0022E22F33|nr:FAD-binding protein [Eggerthella sinensis]
MPKNWDYECDILVVGYGGAGMWASLIGADECGQSVLVLEKAPVRGGGNSSINNGEFAIINDAEGMRQYWHEMTQDVDTPSEVIDAWIEEGLRNCEYADKYDLEYDINEKAIAGTIPEYSFLPGGAGCQSIADPPGFGMASFEILDQKRKDLGVDVLFDCHDEHLIQNPTTKEIVGCTVTIGSEEKTVKARKGTILCTGGFEFNEDMKRKYLKCYPFKFEGWKYNTGDGIRMTEEVGGKLWHMGLAGAMYGMWTRDPENDFLVLMMPSDQTFIYTDRLASAGWTRRASARRTTAGTRSPTSATKSAITTTAPAGACSTRRCSSRAPCPPVRAIGSSAATSPPCCPTSCATGKAGRTTTRPRWTRDGSSSRHA